MASIQAQKTKSGIYYYLAEKIDGKVVKTYLGTKRPITNRMKYGKLRRYTCRKCGAKFKDYHLPEEKRVCTRCATDQNARKCDVSSTMDILHHNDV